MILEGIVTSIAADGAPHLAPMGPEVSRGFGQVEDVFLLRPFRSSTTCGNLLARPEGVLHVTDDVLLLAQAAIGAARAGYAPSTVVKAPRLADCCRFFEFRIESVDASQDRVRMNARVVHAERIRDFFGFNRGKHAVVEAAILASRVQLLSPQILFAEMERLRIPVDKTGGEREHQAFDLLERFVREQACRRSPDAAPLDPSEGS